MALKPIVKLSITALFAVVQLNTLEILSLNVIFYVRIAPMKIFIYSNLKFLVETIELVPSTNPCQPSPCGPNSECKVSGDSPACSCLPEFIGSPPNCRPECISNSDCSEHLACINRKCKDPCPGACGSNAECRVISHTPNCVCMLGFTGDPFYQCSPQLLPVHDEFISPCTPSPCGANAECRTQDNAGSCTCLPDYVGDPYSGCRPECTIDSDCPYNKACIRNKCGNPCPGTCGTNADCQVIDHLPSCTCRLGYTGNPFIYCNLIPEKSNDIVQVNYEHNIHLKFLLVVPVQPTNPCLPSPCGPNSECRVVQQQAVCSCLPNYNGSPPSCRPECVVNSECPLTKACVNQKCIDPCQGTCGINTVCKVLNHSPICSCREQYTGDPFSNCYLVPCKFLNPGSYN